MFYSDPITVWVDGVSDMSEYVSQLASTFVNAARSRLISISKYSSFKDHFNQLNSFLTYLYDIIPDEIDIPGTQIYTQGGL